MRIELTYLDYQSDVFFDWQPGIKYKVVRKGRRAGITKGAANAIIEYLLDGHAPVLWGDTIHGNIDRYFQRYFLPELKENKIPFHWDAQKKQLTIRGQFCDFRSADNPENWEGFGYKYIFLNEAGIILKNKELYTNTVLPMLLDYPDSRLIAAGVPKGKILKDGSEHPFYTLQKRAEQMPEIYQTYCVTSYDNPLLDHDGIKALEEEMASISPQAIPQEIYGEFIESDALNPFAYQWDDFFHTGEEAVYDHQKRLYISIDFNLNPFAVTFWHYWQDQGGYHIHGIGEAEIQQGNIPDMVKLIKDHPQYGKSLHTAILTGDAMGNQQNLSLKSNASHYMVLRKELGLMPHQVIVPANPTHENSRTEVNRLLHLAKIEGSKYHLKLHPRNMRKTIQDFHIVQCDAFGGIVKRNRHDLSQHADLMDCSRYLIHTLVASRQIKLI